MFFSSRGLKNIICDDSVFVFKVNRRGFEISKGIGIPEVADQIPARYEVVYKVDVRGTMYSIGI
jgi:hypothetical protein